MKKPALQRTVARRRTNRFDEQTLAWADAHLHCRRHNTASLARVMGVSTATASRIVASLRKKFAKDGVPIVTVREGKTWHYEIRDEDLVRRQMKRMLDKAGFIKGPPILRPGETVDDVLYPKTGKCP